MSLPNPADLISQMAIRLKAHLEHRVISEPRFIGIRTGGVWVAQALLEELGSDSPLGVALICTRLSSPPLTIPTELHSTSNTFSVPVRFSPSRLMVNKFPLLDARTSQTLTVPSWPADASSQSLLGLALSATTAFECPLNVAAVTP